MLFVIHRILLAVPDLYLPPETFMGNHMQDLLPSEVADQFLSAVQQINQGAPLVSIEYMLSVPAGKKYFEARHLHIFMIFL